MPELWTDDYGPPPLVKGCDTGENGCAVPGVMVCVIARSIAADYGGRRYGDRRFRGIIGGMGVSRYGCSGY